MNTSQPILNIEAVLDALVSDENPACVGTLDYERCARLHNFIIAHAWIALHGNAPDVDALASEKQIFWKEEGESIRESLHPPLNSYLDLILDPGIELFYWVGELRMTPAECFIEEGDEFYQFEGKPRFILIYGSDIGVANGSHTLGLVYDQQLNRATVLMTIEDVERVEEWGVEDPFDLHENLWFPLETILTNWIYMIYIGKIVAGQSNTDLQSSSSFEGLWTWRPYCDAQIDSTTAAIEHYSAIVESRMPPNPCSTLPISTPLFTDQDLDAASIPQDCFIRSLLRKLKTPNFKFIAPGLEVPHDKEAFARRQKFTNLPYREGTIPAVLLFSSSERTVNLNHEIRIFEKPHIPSYLNDGDSIPTGLYSAPIERSWHHSEETGFYLLLPYPLRVGLQPNENGPYLSDGTNVVSGSHLDLFQHGDFHPFGGHWRPQRLERLFERWTELIEDGIWTVGKDGVEGGIDKFREADHAWDDYWIAPTW